MRDVGEGHDFSSVALQSLAGSPQIFRTAVLEMLNGRLPGGKLRRRMREMAE
jgi:hypothetical protein